MATTQILSNVTLQPGTRSFGPAPIPNGINTVSIAVDRANWTNPAVTLSVMLDISLDGGVTWASINPGPSTNPFPISFEAMGGTITDKTGAVIPQSLITAQLPAGTNRRVQGSVKVAGGPLTTSVTLTTT